LDAANLHTELHTLDELSRWALTETRDLDGMLNLSSIN
jgi:hypothetical protein